MAAVVINVFDSEAGTTSEYSFDKSPVRIGRNPLNDLTLPFPFVSGWHAVVRFDDAAARFYDLGSTNGTLHHGRRIQAGEAVDVGEGLVLTIGKLNLQIQPFRGHERSKPPAAPLPSPASTDGFRPTNAMPAQPPPVTAEPPPIAPSYPPPMMEGSLPPAGPPVVGLGQPPSRGTAHVEMSDVHQLVHRLRPLHQSFRATWSGLKDELQTALGSMPPPMRPFAVSILQREFPELATEPEFGQLTASLGVPTDVPRTAAVPGPARGDSQAVAALARSLRPDEEPPRTLAEVQRFLSCVEDVLRASAKAFVELQKGQEQFGKEMGVRVIREFTALHAAGTAENVLKYLLDWQQGGAHRTQELVGVYADLMIHQVALINGVMEGIRSLLARLAPEEIERGVTAGWPTRAAAVWKQYAEKHRELTSEDRNIMAAVFGPEFARAYAEVGGEGPSGGRG